MKKVLILTTSTGQGHNQAADALIDILSQNDFSCTKYDFLASNSKFINKFIVKSYEISASYFPKIYGLIYRLTDTKFHNKILNMLFTLISNKLYKFIMESSPDIIIGTHPFTALIISRLKQKKNLKVPFISVITDFKAHAAYINNNVDAYITGSDYTKEHLVKNKIPPNIIYPLGIPVRESFYLNNAIIPKIKDTEYFSILLMSGSMGLNNISYVFDELLKNKNKLRLTVVCGNNHKLKEKLLKKYNIELTDKKIHILGYTTDIASLMEYSDVIISKPGGLTVTESIIKNLPLIIPFIIPGQETDNANFLSTEGYSFYIHKYKEINPLIDKLIEQPSILLDKKNKLNELSSIYSIRNIVDICNKLIEEHE